MFTELPVFNISCIPGLLSLQSEYLFVSEYCRFTEPPVLNMAQVVDDSTCNIPLIFVLSAGVVRINYYTHMSRRMMTIHGSERAHSACGCIRESGSFK